MKYYSAIFIFFVALTFVFGQRKALPVKKFDIDLMLIDYCEIAQIKGNNKFSKFKRLNKSQVEKFVANWNDKSKTIVPCQQTYQYMLSLYYKDLTRKDYYFHNNIISDNKVYCIDSRNPGFADALFKGK